MAGTVKNNHSSINHQSNNQNQQSNNISMLSDMGIMMIMGSGGNAGGSSSSSYYSRCNSSFSSSSPSSSMANICQTVQSSPSPMRTSLMKKRMYSTSPSKPYSPPLSLNHHQNNFFVDQISISTLLAIKTTQTNTHKHTHIE